MWERTVAGLARAAGVSAERLVDEHQRRVDARLCQGDDVATANTTAYRHIAERLGAREAS